MTTIAVSDIVKAPQGDGYVTGIVLYVEPRKGFRRSYPYAAVDVELEDGSKITVADFNLITA